MDVVGSPLQTEDRDGTSRLTNQTTDPSYERYGTMIAPLRALRTTALVLTISIGALTAASQLAPVSHAANFPDITSTATGPGQVRVTGDQFTPGGKVELIVTNANHVTVRRIYTTATTKICTIVKCYPGGHFDLTLNFLPTWQTDHVMAFNMATGAFTYWDNVYVY